MTDEFDIEALLDAPFKKILPAKARPGEQVETTAADKSDKKQSSRRGRSRSRSREAASRHHRSSRRSRSPHNLEKQRDGRRDHREHDYRRDRASTREHRHHGAGSRERRHHSRDPSPKHPPRAEAQPIVKARSKSPVLSAAQRDRRTVFVQQLAQRLTEAELCSFCEKAGRVRAARIVTDKISRRSKGVAYVEYYEEESVPKAIALTGQKLCGIPVIVEITETEKNRLAEEAAEETRRNKSAASHSHNRLWVSGLHLNLGETEIRRVFEPFGELDFVNVQREADGASKGFAFVQYKSPEDALRASEQMNGFDLAGKTIRLGLVRDKTASLSSYANLDDAENVGLNMSAQTRTELMLKLAREESLVRTASPASASAAPALGISRPSSCIVLQHMYDLAAEGTSSWAAGLAEEIGEECSRFGAIEHLHVARTEKGEVFLRFGSVQAGEAAVAAMRGRWFAGRQIDAAFVNPDDYQLMFPHA